MVIGQPTPAGPVGFHKGTTTTLATGWPLAAGLIFVLLGVILGTQGEVSTTSPGGVTVMLLLALVALGAGVVAQVRTPTALPSRPFVGLAAAVAALLALAPVTSLTDTVPLPLFLLSGPWRYLLTPLIVHFAFAIGWPHRHREWSGMVVGWYTLHIALLVAAIGGYTANEAPLFEMVDGLILRHVLDPLGVATAVVALGLAVASRTRRGPQRRANAWAFAAVLLGAGPTALAPLVPALNAPLDGPMTAARLAIAALALLSLAAVLSLPLVNPVNRDLQAHRLAQRLLDDSELGEALRDLAAVLRAALQADGVTIRLATPPLAITEGDVRAVPDEPIAPEAETLDDQRTLVAPIGRAGQPLGEVRLDAVAAGTFGRRERDWLTAFLLPIATALRARRREQLLRDRNGQVVQDAVEASNAMHAALARLPQAAFDETLAVPPPVDASEVLAQLSDGLDGVSRRSDDLEMAATDSRTRIRDANDQVAQALDGLRAFTDDLLRLAAWGEAIAVSNQAVSGVAFRTNLLANNAALEATRAGTAGKTFGVLAEEIRRLADATAESSGAIEAATRSLGEELASRVAALEALQAVLVGAIREAEGGEDAARRVAETAGEVLAHARSLKPAVEEAYAVARRRSARDEKLTATTERLFGERETLARTLAEHRAALDAVRSGLERLGATGRRR